MQKLTIDRFEGDIAVLELEDGELIDVARDQLPEEAMEGDILLFDGKDYTVAVDETAERRKQIEKLMDQLWED